MIGLKHSSLRGIFMDKSNCSKSLSNKNSSNYVPNTLNRFISIDRMFDIISKKKIKMSDHKYWEDKNDKCVLDKYKTELRYKSLFALCFLCEPETIYHWKCFAKKMDTCCIEFDGKKLINSIRDKKCFKYGKVKYIPIKKMKEKLTKVECLPFSKRHPYRNEAEYRIIFVSKSQKNEKIIPINNSSMVNKITINPYLPERCFKIIKKELSEVYTIKEVNRSTVIENPDWKNHVNQMNRKH